MLFTRNRHVDITPINNIIESFVYSPWVPPEPETMMSNLVACKEFNSLGFSLERQCGKTSTLVDLFQRLFFTTNVALLVKLPYSKETVIASMGFGYKDILGKRIFTSMEDLVKNHFSFTDIGKRDIILADDMTVEEVFKGLNASVGSDFDRPIKILALTS